MNITGLQKMTLLDYPGKVACTVFLQGCNFRCPFCHNGGLLDGAGDGSITQEALLEFLARRQGLLDGVCITGGEPTLNPELPSLLSGIKALGYPVKLDTNGSNPKLLRELVSAGLVDYVAMDVKNSPSRYCQTIGLRGYDLEKIEESLRFLLGDPLDYELRTTVVRELHDKASITEMGQWLRRLSPHRKVKKWFLQYFVNRDSVLDHRLTPPESSEMSEYRELLRPFADEIAIRG